VAMWSPNTQTWSALGSGLNGTCLALEFCNGKLYVGGQFTTAGGQT